VGGEGNVHALNFSPPVRLSAIDGDRTCCSVHSKPSQEYRSLVVLFIPFSTSTAVTFIDMATMHGLAGTLPVSTVSM
jgi:hypothetical protein